MNLTPGALSALLSATFVPSDIGKPMTVREYLRDLLLAVLEQGESFSGKRPFGNSGWEENLVIPMIEAGVLAGTIDAQDPDYPEAFDWDEKDFDLARCHLVEMAMGLKE